MKKMNTAEIYAFLAAGTRTGKLATTRPDGRPHVAPIWFVVDGKDLVFTTMATSVKGKNLAGDGRAALTVDDENFPYAFASVEGTVILSHDEKLQWATRIAQRYMPPDLAAATGRRNAVPEEWVVRLTPGRVLGKSELAS